MVTKLVVVDEIKLVLEVLSDVYSDMRPVAIFAVDDAPPGAGADQRARLLDDSVVSVLVSRLSIKELVDRDRCRTRRITTKIALFVKMSIWIGLILLARNWN